MGTTVEMLGSGSAPKGECRAVGDSPNDGGTPCCSSGDDRRRLYGENAGSSHSGCGWSVNGGGMLSGARGAEKSTFAGGRLRRASPAERVRCAVALDSSALRDASVGYGPPALSGLIGLEPTGPRARVATGGRLRVNPGPCSPGGRPGRGVALYVSSGSLADVNGGTGKPCEGLRQAGSSSRPRRLGPGIPGPAS